MITLDFRDSRPVYEQIVDKIKGLIISGALSGGERIMSVRELAGKITVNPNTIAKAYKQLESEGFIYSVVGKGYFVADKNDAANCADAETLLRETEKKIKELLFLGVEKEKLTDIIEKTVKEMKKND